MFYIFGSPRSGTTLIAQCVNAHPDVIVPHDTNFLASIALAFDRISDEKKGKDVIKMLIINSSSFENSIGEYLTRESVASIIEDSAYSLVQIIENLFAEIAHKAGRKYSGNKSTGDLEYIGVLYKTGILTENVKIVHVVRDCRDVMTSLISVGWINKNNTNYARVWSNQNILLHEQFKRTSNYFLIKYEDFVSSPEAIMRHLSRFIGIEYSQNMLDPKLRHKRYEDMSNIHPRIFMPIDGASVGKYKKSLEEGVLEKYVCQAHEALRLFRYI